jgi:hypothetical protein
MNIFLAAFTPEDDPRTSLRKPAGIPLEGVLQRPNFGLSQSTSRVGDASTTGTIEKPTLFLEGPDDDRKKFYAVPWGELGEADSGGSFDLNSLTKILRCEWRKPSPIFDLELKLLNYDLDRDPKYINVEVNRHFIVSQQIR